MDKIYSRKRIKILRITKMSPITQKTKNHRGMNIQKNDFGKFIKITIIIFIAITTMGVILKAVTPIYDTLCINRAKSIATVVTNEKATKVMKDYEYEDLVEIIKNEDGKINMIKYNIITINKIISDVAIQIQNELDEKSAENIQIAIRKLHRNKNISRTWTKDKNTNSTNRKYRNRL